MMRRLLTSTIVFLLLSPWPISGAPVQPDLEERANCVINIDFISWWNEDALTRRRFRPTQSGSLEDDLIADMKKYWNDNRGSMSNAQMSYEVICKWYAGSLTSPSMRINRDGERSDLH